MHAKTMRVILRMIAVLARRHVLAIMVTLTTIVVWDNLHAKRIEVELVMIAVLAYLHALTIPEMSTAVVAREKVHAQIISAALEKTVGKDESHVANFMYMAFLLYL